MGLFDFLKKKKLTQSSSAKELNAPNSQGIQSKESAPPFVKKEVVAKAPLVEISVEQDGPLPLSTLLKTATPSKQGLYPHEIMMLEYAPHFKTTHNNFQNFWYWQYSVTEPQAILDSLFERGFTEVGDLRSALEKLKLPEIKEEEVLHWQANVNVLVMPGLEQRPRQISRQQRKSRQCDCYRKLATK